MPAEGKRRLASVGEWQGAARRLLPGKSGACAKAQPRSVVTIVSCQVRSGSIRSHASPRDSRQNELAINWLGVSWTTQRSVRA